MKIPFWKMHGAGNDFILLDRISTDIPEPSSTMIQTWCKAHTGIGADGILIVKPADCSHDDFRMTFYNPDGHEAGMCGNGARCIARFAYDQGIAPATMRFATSSGNMRARVSGHMVTLEMPVPTHVELAQTLVCDEGTITYDFADTGVPHVIVTCKDLDALNIREMGKYIRWHKTFQPAGTNVDFIQVISENTLRIRTYERGVEAETLACGTGVAAAALTCVQNGTTTSPVNVRTAGEDTLIITVTKLEDTISKLELTGPAMHVFHGVMSM